MKNMDWDSIRVFLAVAEQGSLSAAAQVLLVSQPTIGRQISRLEDQLGLRLFDRRQTGYELTEEGKRLVTEAQAMARGAADFKRAVDFEKSAAPLQVFRITLGEWGLHFLSGKMEAIVAGIDGVRLELYADDAFWDLGMNSADIAIGNQVPKRSHLITQKLGERSFYAYASESYLRSHPDAVNADSWDKQVWAGYCGSRARLKSAQVLSEILAGNECSFAVNSSVALLKILLSGRAMGVLPDWIGEHENLIRLSDRPLARNTSWMSFHERLKLRPKLSEVKRRIVGIYKSRYELTDRIVVTGGP